jgi:hypothetical protein
MKQTSGVLRCEKAKVRFGGHCELSKAIQSHFPERFWIASSLRSRNDERG